MAYEPDSSEALLEITGISVWFKSHRAVRDVSLRLRGGELLGLVGPNGAGKTTMLRCASGLLPPDSGSVCVMGQTVKPGADVLRHIGFTPDTPLFYDKLTVRQYLRFIAIGYDLQNDLDERIDLWLEKVWLKEKSDDAIASLSRGMRQRVGLARTMLPNPQVILLDEPAAGLDPAGRVQFRKLLSDLRAQGKALIVSSHVLADMNEYCTHIGIMSAGEMVQFGTVDEISADGKSDRCRYQTRLTSDPREAGVVLGSIAGIDGITVQDHAITFEYSRSPESAAQLLTTLIQSGVSVASFAPVVADLEQAYLRAGVKQVE